MMNCLIVALGGAIGAVLRFLVTQLPITIGSFPIKTFFINFTGALGAGIFLALVSKRSDIDPNMFLFLRVGILGAYTTFATCFTESYSFIKNGQHIYGLFYVLFSVACAYAGIYASDILIK